jgi:hypothetical protein
MMCPPKTRQHNDWSLTKGERIFSPLLSDHDNIINLHGGRVFTRPGLRKKYYGTQEQVDGSNFNPLRLQAGWDKLQLLPEEGSGGFEVGLA